MWTEKSDYRTVSEVKGQRSAAGQHTHKTFLHVKDIPAVPLLLLPLQLFLLFHAV